MLNKNMLALGSNRSVIRELFEQGKILKEKFGDDNVYDFSIGNPSVACPDLVNDTIINLIKCENPIKLHGYTSAQGDKNVRESISNYLNRTYNAKTSGDLIYMTTGAAAALSIAIKALTDGNGDNEAIVFAPFFPEYSVFIKNSNAKVITVSPDINTFYPNLADFENKINKNTNLVIINSPNNPTGVLYKEDVIKDICSIVSKKQKDYNHPIYIISDEPYRELIYTSDSYPFITNYYNNTIVTYSFSKSMSLPGERIGYILVNPDADNANDIYFAICGAGRSLGYVCATSLFQYVVEKCQGTYTDINLYKKNADILKDELNKIGYSVINPDGAFYLFIKSPIPDDNEFSKKALDYNLLIVPSESFGIKGYIRLATCVKESQIISSIPKFRELYNYYMK